MYLVPPYPSTSVLHPVPRPPAHHGRAERPGHGTKYVPCSCPPHAAMPPPVPISTNRNRACLPSRGRLTPSTDPPPATRSCNWEGAAPSCLQALPRSSSLSATSSSRPASCLFPPCILYIRIAISLAALVVGRHSPPSRARPCCCCPPAFLLTTRPVIHNPSLSSDLITSLRETKLRRARKDHAKAGKKRPSSSQLLSASPRPN